jgi:alkanesulfonate monooxygenase SsuD/methylene tetrahydromethanopterin reductase-like flavin-dependent oxidoreductase (luciferase family)
MSLITGDAIPAVARSDGGRGTVRSATMRTGVFLPIFDELADPATLARLAARAEDRGWDGVFLWDHVIYRPPTASATDPWIALAAMAVATERVQLGPMVTPLARRRPWIVARQAVALDRLSAGRFVLGLGLGLDASGGELSRFGEEVDDRRRAGMLDEGLDVLTSLLRGAPVSYRGTHYQVDDVRFLPTPARPGGMPIWLAARWPNRRPVARALRHDGVFLIDTDDPSSLDDIVAAAERRDRPFDVVVQGLPGADVTGWRAAGATWWLARFDPFDVTVAAVESAIDAGPPA